MLKILCNFLNLQTLFESPNFLESITRSNNILLIFYIALMVVILLDLTIGLICKTPQGISCFYIFMIFYSISAGTTCLVLCLSFLC